MKYLWLILGFVFAGIVVYKMVSTGTWDSVSALWSLVAWLKYDVDDLQEKIKKTP